MLYNKRKGQRDSSVSKGCRTSVTERFSRTSGNDYNASTRRDVDGNSQQSPEGTGTSCPKLSRTTTEGIELLDNDPKPEKENNCCPVTTNINVFDVVFGTSGTTTYDSSLPALSHLDSIDSTEDDASPQNHEARQLQTCHKRRSSEIDVDKYMARREMTPFQERLNAITIIPGAFYCFLFLLSGSWLSDSLKQEGPEVMTISGELVMDETLCLTSTWLPHLHALPPLPVIAVASGIICHAPFSFIYHWSYAHRLPAGLPRTIHWSRRMDQAMIHFCSTCMAYAMSGRFDFFLVNLFYNLDCCYRQFKQRVRPRRNQIRILISVVACTIPIFRRGDLDFFAKLWALFFISFWLFGMYPIGGWSHAAFHLVMAFVPPLLMDAALDLPASQAQLKIAAKCAIIAKASLAS